MRNQEQLYQKYKDIQECFNNEYKALIHGAPSAKYNIACANTAAKFYLSIRRIQDILKMELEAVTV